MSDADVESRLTHVEEALFGPADSRRRGSHAPGLVVQVGAMEEQLDRIETRLTEGQQSAMAHHSESEGLRRALRLVAALLVAQAALVSAIVAVVRVL